MKVTKILKNLTKYAFVYILLILNLECKNIKTKMEMQQSVDKIITIDGQLTETEIADLNEFKSKLEGREWDEIRNTINSEPALKNRFMQQLGFEFSSVFKNYMDEDNRVDENNPEVEKANQLYSSLMTGLGEQPRTPTYMANNIKYFNLDNAFKGRQTIFSFSDNIKERKECIKNMYNWTLDWDKMIIDYSDITNQEVAMRDIKLQYDALQVNIPIISTLKSVDISDNPKLITLLKENWCDSKQAFVNKYENILQKHKDSFHSQVEFILKKNQDMLENSELSQSEIWKLQNTAKFLKMMVNRYDTQYDRKDDVRANIDFWEHLEDLLKLAMVNMWDKRAANQANGEQWDCDLG